MPRPTASRKLLMFILYGTMFLFGFLENVKGVSFPLIKNEFSASYEAQGKMLSILSFSYTLFVIASGFLLGRFGIKRLYILGYLCALLSLVSVNFMPGFWTVTGSLVFLFAGFGIFEIAVNSMATQIFTKKAALMMSLLHFMYGAGATVGPKAAGMLADPAGPGLLWRQIYLFTVPLVAVLFIPSVLAKFPRGTVPESAEAAPPSAAPPSAAAEEPPRKSHGFITALKRPAVWAFGITLGVMVGLELASANWGGLYFQDMYGLDPTTSGANFISAFFILFTLSRLASGFLIEKIGYMRSLIGAILSVTVIFIAGFLMGAAGIYVLPLLGLFLAIFWPTFMAVAMGYFGADAPVMTSAIIAIAGLLNVGIQFVMGYINLWIGTGWGYRSCLLFAVVLIFLILGVNRSIRGKKETAGQVT